MMVLAFHRCIFNATLSGKDTVTPPEDLSAVYSKDLVINVFRDGQWGSFRHIPLQSGMLPQLGMKHICWVEMQVVYYFTYYMFYV
jgi:hypothetical protein